MEEGPASVGDAADSGAPRSVLEVQASRRSKLQNRRDMVFGA
jgi:hypothetical protein